jgi:YidC/Oxa1 family membrane protein insertase
MISSAVRCTRPLRRVVYAQTKLALGSNGSVRLISSTLPRLDDKAVIPPEIVIPDPAKLSSSSSMGDIANAISDDGMVSVVKQLGYHPFDLVCVMLDNIHLTLDVPYWQSIVLATIGLRIITLPIGIKSMQNSSRLAALRPHMAKLSENAKKDSNHQQRYTTELYALWKKYKVNPLKAMVLPFVQLPIFISVFFGVKQMGTFCPEFSSGGALWFTDLAAADPMVILPIVNAASFLLMFEMNSDGFQTEDNNTFKMVMRGLSLIMVPLTYSLPSVS